MLYAKTRDGQKLRANIKNKNKGIEAYCPFCDWPKCENQLRYNIGKVKTDYFSHPPNSNCDPWSRGKETEWHQSWKKLINKNYCEVTVEKNGVKHRADIQNKNGLVIELQNSPISVSEIYEREKFYKNMIWLFNGKASNIIPHRKTYSYYWPNNCYEIIWANPRKTILSSQKRIFIDIGNEEIVYLQKNVDGLYYYNSNKEIFAGYIIKQSDFIDYFFKCKNILIFDQIRDSLLESCSWYFEQLETFEIYFDWLFSTKANRNHHFLRNENEIFNYYFSTNRLEKHKGNLWLFIEEFPQYRNNEYFLLKTIKLGFKSHWHKVLKENKLNCTY
jgi:hypothetical protein